MYGGHIVQHLKSDQRAKVLSCDVVNRATSRLSAPSPSPPPRPIFWCVQPGPRALNSVNANKSKRWLGDRRNAPVRAHPFLLSKGAKKPPLPHPAKSKNAGAGGLPAPLSTKKGKQKENSALRCSPAATSTERPARMHSYRAHTKSSRTKKQEKKAEEKPPTNPWRNNFSNLNLLSPSPKIAPSSPALAAARKVPSPKPPAPPSASTRVFPSRTHTPITAGASTIAATATARSTKHSPVVAIMSSTRTADTAAIEAAILAGASPFSPIPVSVASPWTHVGSNFSLGIIQAALSEAVRTQSGTSPEADSLTASAAVDVRQQELEKSAPPSPIAECKEAEDGQSDAADVEAEALSGAAPATFEQSTEEMEITAAASPAPSVSQTDASPEQQLSPQRDIDMEAELDQEREKAELDEEREIALLSMLQIASCLLESEPASYKRDTIKGLDNKRSSVTESLPGSVAEEDEEFDAGSEAEEANAEADSEAETSPEPEDDEFTVAPLDYAPPSSIPMDGESLTNAVAEADVSLLAESIAGCETPVSGDDRASWFSGGDTSYDNDEDEMCFSPGMESTPPSGTQLFHQIIEANQHCPIADAGYAARARRSSKKHTLNL